MRASRVKPYLLPGAALLPIVAGLWIWIHVPEPGGGSQRNGITHNSPVIAPMIRSAHVRAGEGGVLIAHVELGQSSDGSIGTRFQWYLNGQPLPGQTAQMLPVGVAKQGDRVLVEVIPNNGTIDGAVTRSPVFAVGNAAPTILSLRFDPSAPRVGDRLSVITEVTDADDHEVTLSYRWLRNGRLVQDGRSHQLAPEELRRGDRVVVEAVPHDGRAEGTPVQSDEVTIGNGIPRITSTPTFSAQGSRLEYAVTAVDPDNDPLTFTLGAGPAGMTIEKETGRLVWTPVPGSAGTQRVRIEARDGYDGMAPQEFDVAVPPSAGDSPSPTS